MTVNPKCQELSCMEGLGGWGTLRASVTGLTGGGPGGGAREGLNERDRES